MPPPRSVSPEFEVEFTAARTARESLPEGARFTRLPTRDEVGAASGFVLYRTPIEVAGRQVLQLAEARDRALVSIEGEPVGTLMRGEERAIALPSDASGWLEALGEDLGRVSYGPRIGEAKGLIGPVTLGGMALTDWEVAPLDLELGRTQPSTAVDGKPLAGPVFAHTEFELEEQLDLFLHTRGARRGERADRVRASRPHCAGAIRGRAGAWTGGCLTRSPASLTIGR